MTRPSDEPIAFVVPGSLDQLTGGYLFDRRIVEGLRARGRLVRVIELSPRDPAAGGNTLGGLPEGTITVVDGLALATCGPLVAAQARRLRLVAFVHGPLALEAGLSPAAVERTAALEAAQLSQVSGIVCPSRTTAAAIEAYGIPAHRIAVAPPGTARPPHPPNPQRGPVRRLLCVANLVSRKGHIALVEAVDQLRDLDWSLVCVGSLDRDLAVARAVRSKILAAGLARRITLAGEYSPLRVAAAYRQAQAFVLPSLHEGYGMVFAEAMAHGLPVIATTAGAIPETVPPQAGLLVPPGDPDALARALRRLIAEPALARRLAAGSRRAGLALPDWRQATAVWETAVDRLAGLDAHH